MNIRLGPIVCAALSLAAFGVGAGSPAHAGQQKPPAPPQASAEQQDLAALSQAVDAVSAGTQQPSSDLTVSWISNHFIKSQGDSVYVPFSVSINRSQLTSPQTAFYVRVVSKGAPAAAPAAAPATPGARPSYPWDTIHFIEVPADGKISRAIALPPGTYDAFVAVKDKSSAPAPAPAAGAAPPAAPKIGIVRHELTVPAFPDTQLTTSDVILARALEQLPAALPPDKQQENPYVFGPLKVIPALDSAFANSADLQVLFWIYGASQTGGKPDVVVEFSFHQRQPDGTEKYFNKTAPQDMNEKTLPPEFNLTAGHQLLSSLAIPLKSFPPGAYRLEVKVTDKPSGRNLTKNVNFTVSGS